MYRTLTAVVLGTALSATAIPAVAQNANVNANNLVSVNVSDVANELAENLSVDVSDIPVTVQVPVGIAANVCDVTANVLASGGEDAPAECDATTTSNALNKRVERAMADAGDMTEETDTATN